MQRKIFISYSHKDENHKEDLEDHLATLKRQGVIQIWHDRKILAGDDWKGKIDHHLNDAEIIVFLISPSFLASEYCFDVEVRRAMERHAEGAAKIIPIIVRPCLWQESEFSEFQVVPRDGQAITLWSDKDSAWLDAISGLKKYIDEFFPITSSTSSLLSKAEVIVSAEQERWLSDTEIILTHRKVDKVKLNDIYVLPDIEFERELKEKDIDILESSVLYKTAGRYLLLGDEQQGKTSFLKKSFIELASKSYLPLYVDATKVTKIDIDKLIKRGVAEQYNGLSFDEFISSQSKILLLDNLDQIGLNEKYRNIFLNKLADTFDWTIATCRTAFGYIRTETPALAGYKAADLLGFGNYKREEIVLKWISLGMEESIDEAILYSKCDELKKQLDIVIKRNIVPPKPIYILMLMQMFEAYAQQNLELTSYGHCYQQLIYQCFEKANISGRDYEKYLNILTEISWAIFLQGNGLNQKQIDDFFDDYGRKYLSVNKTEVLGKLKAHSVLSDKSRKIHFKYPYIYYFFVGKKFAEGYPESEEIKDKVQLLLDNLHREDFANILIFITHHTKDSWVLTKIKEVLSSLFDGQQCATLTKEQLSFMDDFMRKIPELVLEQREIQKERDDRNKSLDIMERGSLEEKHEHDESLDTYSNINRSFKSMEIAGQIIRNRHATMTRDTLYELASSGASTGLRFLDYFIKISDASKSEIINFIVNILSEYPNLTNREVQTHAESAYLHLTYSVINGVVGKIASSIGSKEAYEIYEELAKQENTPAYTLINQAVELQFKRMLDIDSIQKTMDKLRGNPVCLRILKEMVIQHIYMFPVAYKEKQQLSEMLGISVRGQHLMDQNKLGKG
ncbi:TIR domain-containing protein [Azotobacter beijerinckii]|uniref:TIR domain-containing protein n=1 Tax=Azotobacter beijerinckii TaxID=170623 RepID=A0A1H9PV24_9GAMM|nr:toll/interleukin-1 receptor domain-containing protein [Azotobacter beijerinckii]SER52022.1 TIR domain-containing protein [Azotobacter beijerinckii]